MFAISYEMRSFGVLIIAVGFFMYWIGYFYGTFSSNGIPWSVQKLKPERRYRIVDRRCKQSDQFLLEDWENGTTFWCRIPTLRDVAETESTEFAMKSEFPLPGFGIAWLSPEKSSREIDKEERQKERERQEYVRTHRPNELF